MAVFTDIFKLLTELPGNSGQQTNSFRVRASTDGTLDALRRPSPIPLKRRFSISVRGTLHWLKETSEFNLCTSMRSLCSNSSCFRNCWLFIVNFRCNVLYLEIYFLKLFKFDVSQWSSSIYISFLKYRSLNEQSFSNFDLAINS